MRVKIAFVVKNLIIKSGLSDKEAAKFLGITRIQVNHILNGQLTTVSLNTLTQALKKFGYRIAVEGDLSKKGLQLVLKKCRLRTNQ